MAEETSTIRCPRCGAQIARETPPEGETLSGSPLRSCPDCGRLYFDEAYAEPALTAFEKAKIGFPWIKVLYAVVPTAGALVYLGPYLNSRSTATLVPLAAFGVIAVFFDVLLIAALVKALGKRKMRAAALAQLEGGAGAPETLRTSMERLSRKDYLDVLVKCGEDVPKYFYRRIGAEPPKFHRKK